MRKPHGVLKKLTLLLVLILLVIVTNIHGCRRVTLVGDSLLGCQKDVFVDAINLNGGESWVYTEHVMGGCTSYTNPINRDIYSKGLRESFGMPDTVVFSFATNDMYGVTVDNITMESARASMHMLINQAVSAGATCIIMLESLHRFRSPGVPLNDRFEMNMDDWFRYWHAQTGDRTYLGLPYRLLIADAREALAVDPDSKFSDPIHFTPQGAAAAAGVIVDKINECPEGRWLFGQDAMKPDHVYPPNPHEGAVQAEQPSTVDEP